LDCYFSTRGSTLTCAWLCCSVDGQCPKQLLAYSKCIYKNNNKFEFVRNTIHLPRHNDALSEPPTHKPHPPKPNPPPHPAKPNPQFTINPPRQCTFPDRGTNLSPFSSHFYTTGLASHQLAPALFLPQCRPEQAELEKCRPPPANARPEGAPF